MVKVGHPMAMENEPLPAQPLASVALTVMAAVVTTVGVPLTTPEEVFKLNPAGRVPLLIA